MATVLFFEKPGCATNARQKKALSDAGHQLQARSILSEPWNPARLRAFFGEEPVNDWFNRAAPRIKSGEILPDTLQPEQALDLMVEDPLLIRRPLVEALGRKCAGFQREPVLSLLAHVSTEGGETDPEGCSRTTTGGTCPPPKSNEETSPT